MNEEQKSVLENTLCGVVAHRWLLQVLLQKLAEAFPGPAEKASEYVHEAIALLIQQEENTAFLEKRTLNGSIDELRIIASNVQRQLSKSSELQPFPF
jgi:hypothetical protein